MSRRRMLLYGLVIVSYQHAWALLGIGGVIMVTGAWGMVFSLTIWRERLSA